MMESIGVDEYLERGRKEMRNNHEAFRKIERKFPSVSWEEWKAVAHEEGRFQLGLERERLLDEIVNRSIGPTLWNATQKIMGNETTNRKAVCSDCEYEELRVGLNEASKQLEEMDERITAKFQSKENNQ